MGLDMYLCSRTKESYAELKAHEEIVAKANEECDKVFKEKWLNFYITLPKFPMSRDLDFDKFTTEQNRFCDEFKREYREIREKCGIKYDSDGYEVYPTIESEFELGYWRKAYDLHSYLFKKFGVNGKSDNLTRLLLDEEKLNAIIEDLDKKSMNSDDFDYEYTTRVFKRALRLVKSGEIVYYYAWY